MNGCIYRTKDNECDLWTDDKHKAFCDPDCTDKHPSNGDCIRDMTDEELADLLWETVDGAYYQIENFMPQPPKGWWLEWLKQEAN